MIPSVRLGDGNIREQPGTFSIVKNGEIQGSASAVQLPDVPCYMVKFKSAGGNSGSFYIGGAGVTIPDGTADTTSGFEIEKGEQTDWIPVNNLNVFYLISSHATDELTYLALI